MNETFAFIQSEDYIEICLKGEAIYGDDFVGDQLNEWIEREKEAYAKLAGLETSKYSYEYHAMNFQHGFRYLKNKRFRRVLGLGSARGDELLPIQDKFDKAILVEPSEAAKSVLKPEKVEYVRPNEDGSLPFPDNYFDLIVAFGVLHHIPHVSYSLKEIGRVAAPGALFLVREPVISMGDWRRLRPGLTKNERGIPSKLLLNCVKESEFKVRKWKYVMFPIVASVCNKFNVMAFNSKIIVGIDEIFCFLTFWNLRYHATKLWHKVRPTSVFAVLEKMT